jgi:transposase
LRQLISNSNGRKSIVIADNVSYHKSAKTKSFLTKSNLEIMYLPPYSPEFNPIEQVWKWIKPLVNGISTVKKGISELLSRFRKICWHWKYSKLHNPLKIGLGIWSTCYTYL